MQSKLAEQAINSARSPEEVEYYVQLAKSAQMIKYCVIIIATIPMMIIYPRLQKFFEKGVMIGSVKG